MRSSAKWAAIALSMLLITLGLAACGVSGSRAGGAMKPVELKFYNVGDSTPNWETVLEAANAKLKKKINATLDVAFISWGDWQTKYPLVLASGEAFDSIYTSMWCFFPEQSAKGAFLPIDALLPKNAPNIWKTWPKVAWDFGKSDGKILMIPNYLEITVIPNGVTYREDLRKKYNVPEIKTLMDFEAYFDAIKKNEPDMIPADLSMQELWCMYYFYMEENANYCSAALGEPSGNTFGLFYDLHDPKAQLKREAFDPSYAEWVTIAKRWADRSYWPKNALANKMLTQQSFIAGRSAIALWGADRFNSCYVSAKKDHPDWEVSFYYPLSKQGKTKNSGYGMNGQAIGANSKNPERTLMAIDAIMFDKDLFNTIAFGVEGKTYVKNDKGKFTIPPGTDPSKAFGFCSLLLMGLNHKEWLDEGTDTSANSPLATEKLTNINYLRPMSVIPPVAALLVKTDGFKAEAANVNEVNKTLKVPLDMGLVKDPAAALAELKTELEKAGIGKIQTDIQAQFDAYIASKK